MEQIANDHRTWQGYPDKRITLVVPMTLRSDLMKLRTAQGSFIDFYENQNYITCNYFQDRTKIGGLLITAIQVGNDSDPSFIYAFEANGTRVVYAPMRHQTVP